MNALDILNKLYDKGYTDQSILQKCKDLTQLNIDAVKNKVQGDMLVSLALYKLLNS